MFQLQIHGYARSALRPDAFPSVHLRSVIAHLESRPRHSHSWPIRFQVDYVCMYDVPDLYRTHIVAPTLWIGRRTEIRPCYPGYLWESSPLAACAPKSILLVRLSIHHSGNSPVECKATSHLNHLAWDTSLRPFSHVPAKALLARSLLGNIY
ncbi:hypothetical protein AURDEDRAFT_127592 [Auricularia subglabra TFB-10046 SS5]|nr:hypothetical protein AURDEDRAFT_127592 [Auricularia subglabra TFB-10046 SS5]